MSKILRVFKNLFGSGGNQAHFGQFGSRIQTPPGFNTKDPASIQALSAFINNGWLDAINASNKAPFLEDMNGLHFLIFYQLCSIFQDGIPAWDPSTPYFTGSVVRKDGTFELYGSLVDNNVGNALPSQADNGSWHFLNPPSVQPGIISAYGGSAAPFGYLLCDGTAYAQAAQAPLFAAIGTTWNTFNGAAGPGAGNFRVPDLRGLTLMGVGSGTGFSARTLAQLVGEETHLLLQAEMPSHTHGTNESPHHHQKQFGTPGGGDNNFSMNPAGSGAPANTGDAVTGLTIVATGGSGAHNNMQPTAGVNWIIKT